MQIRKATVAVLLPLALALVCYFEHPARGAVLDANFAVPVGIASAVAVHNQQTLGQSFTVENTGTLTRIELQISRFSPTEDLFVDLHRYGDNSPAGLLATIGFTPASVPANLFTDVFTGQNLNSQAFPVIAGEQFAIVVRSAASGLSPPPGSPYECYNWMSTNGSPPGSPTYLDGQFIDVSSTTGEMTTPFDLGFDYGFRAFVTPVPEPSTLVLAALAFVTLAISRRR